MLPKQIGRFEIEEKIAVLDLSTDILRYQLLKKEVTKEQYKKILLNVLKTRSKLGKRESALENMGRDRKEEAWHRQGLLQ